MLLYSCNYGFGTNGAAIVVLVLFAVVAICVAVIAIISENVTIPFAKGEPLFTMVSKRYKTTDIVGYLKSILEDAKPYARMKLMFVGIQGIGKTSLLNRLKEEGMNAAR